ncbi:PxKF domain-containing protein [Actinomadura soli]|nr:PxKF domain-containing protein [Actinomadura soli]
MQCSTRWVRAWSLVAVLVLCGALTASWRETARAQDPQQPCLVPPAGLISLWRGEGSAADAQGVNDGVLNGGAGYVPGRFGSAFNFDGVNDDLVIPASASLTLEQAFTLEFWFSFPTDIVPGSPRFTQGTNFLNKGWTDFFAVQNGAGELELGYDSPRLYSTTDRWLADTWYHTALTYDSGWYSLYVNGNLEATLYRTDPLLGDLEEIYFSHSLATPFNPPTWYAQRLDEIAIYDRALTTAEIGGRAGNCLPAYDFSGFFPPIDNLPVVNTMRAGRAVPVKFALGGYKGLDILAAGYPKSQQIACDSTATVDGVEETTTAGASGLSYNPDTGQYTYVWKTDQSWAGTCRQLIVKLDDGTSHRANFAFS